MATHSQQGFTVIELVLIMLVLGILSAVAVPRFFNRVDFDERAFTDEMISALRYAQKRAVASGCQIQVTANNALNTYALIAETACNNGNFALPLTNPRTGALYPTAAPNGVDIDNINNFPVVFNRRGEANGVAAGDSSLTINGQAINIVQETGLVF
jgi:MSHA pilin protein MshC